ncbi:MAG TPA: hypothetical protein VL588_13140 [Bdellovibrionota bacterium]|nr:hypothetical protein [Bdellovibrionota bacterium]
MRGFRFRIPLSLALLALIAPGADVWAIPTRLSPEWVHDVGGVAPNQSFLDDLTPSPAASKDPLVIMDQVSAARMRQEYEDMTREQTMREAYSLSTPTEDASYMGRVEDFTRHVLRTIFNFHVHDRMKRVEEKSAEARTFGVASRALEKMSVKVDEKFEVGTRADIPNQKGTLWVRSPYIDGSVDVNLGATWQDPVQAAANKLDPRNPNNERYRVSLSRQVPGIDIRGGVTYGLDSTLVTASVSRQLADHLTCEVMTRRGLDPTRSGLAGSEEAVKLDYKLHF